MQKWEMRAYAVSIRGLTGTDASKNFKEGKDGESPWRKLQARAEDGWELISVKAINGGPDGVTTELLYTFKRPIE